jgi:Zn ribbon nucleic-acid-binding protein
MSRDIHLCGKCGGNGTVPIFSAGGSRIGVSECVQCRGFGHLLDPHAPAAEDWRRRFERSQQRWGNLKVRIKDEIDLLSSPTLTRQQQSQYANGIARLRWVLHEMAKSPDVLAEAVADAAPASRCPECHAEDFVGTAWRGGGYGPTIETQYCRQCGHQREVGADADSAPPDEPTEPTS